MRIGPLSLEDRVLVVAEIGNNHEGRMDVARELVRRAAECGVDAVKFQTYRTRSFVSASDPARYERLRSFELAPEQFQELQSLAKSVGLLFLSTPLDLESARVLEPLVDAYKVASGDNNFYPLLRALCRTAKPLVVSSGLCDLDHMRTVKRFVEERWGELGVSPGLAVLHCVSSYPVPPEEANLRAIPLLARELGCTVGYSDHTLGFEACVAAVALGARILEKHFTLDKSYSEFRDHRLSADPEEMNELLQKVRQVERLLGREEKRLQPCEEGILVVARRSIVAARDLPQGHCLTGVDITWIRPGAGLPPGEEGRVLGRRLKRALSFGEPILPSMLE